MTSIILALSELARRSQENLQRTVKYGGRQQLPLPGEMNAFLVLGVDKWAFQDSPIMGWGGGADRGAGTSDC